MRWPWRSLHSTAILPAISSARPQSSFLSLSDKFVTDNGKEFLGNFDKTLQEASIKHIWTYPYTPKMNATCERFNRTLREQFIEFNELLLLRT
jgi:transposase InsO family protein